MKRKFGAACAINYRSSLNYRRPCFSHEKPGLLVRARSVWFIRSIWLVSFNQINKTNQ